MRLPSASLTAAISRPPPTITAIEQIADADRIARLEVVPLKAG